MQSMHKAIEKTIHQEITDRLLSLRSNSQKQWGIMTASQMLAHLALATENAMGKISFPRMLPVGCTLPKEVIESFYNEVPFGKNGPTDPNLVIDTKCIFEDEKTRMLNLLKELDQKGPSVITNRPHSFFGPLSPEQWIAATYKHIDHHLQQFGV